ncbi:MAG: hypothetical protein ACMUIU_00560 [bacterium]
MCFKQHKTIFTAASPSAKVLCFFIDMKSDKKIIRAILIFFLGVAVGIIGIAVVILFYQKSFELFSTIAPAITTLLAAFLGAWFAYLLADNKEKRKEIALRRQAINRAIFVLVRQYNAIKLIQQELDKYRDNPGKAIELPASSINRYEDLVQNFSSLEFILDSESPNLLLELSIEQERFEQAIAAHRLRNKFYIEDLQPTLEEAGLTNRKTNLEESC